MGTYAGVFFGITLAVGLLFPGRSGIASRAKPQSNPAPDYRLSFQRGDPVVGVTGLLSTEVPAECLGDGTVFLNMLIPAAASEGQPITSPNKFITYGPPVEFLVSVPESGEAHEFRLDQLNDLHDVLQKGSYASESDVALLVIAAPQDKSAKQVFTTSDGIEHELPRNVAEHHDYLVMFDRQGNYKKKLQIEDTFALQKIAQFPSGTFLAFGFDRQDHSPKLAMLKDDGTVLKFLDIPKGDARKSMFGTLDGAGKGSAIYVAPVQLVPSGDSIIIVQNKTKFPLLEVNEAGAIRAIKPKLPEGIQINTLIPSDENLYAHVDGPINGSIYELNKQTGVVLRRFQIGDNESGADVACVHEGKFLSFEQIQGALVRLVGTAEPATDAASTNLKIQNSQPQCSVDQH